MAENLLAGKGFVIDKAGIVCVNNQRSLREPVYILFLAGILACFPNSTRLAFVIIQGLLGATVVLAVFIFARDYFSTRVSLTASVLTAFYPYYVVHDTGIHDTTLYTLLILLSLISLRWAAKKNGYRAALMFAVAGILCGLTCLTRASFLPFSILVLPWIVLFAGGNIKLRVVRSAVFASALLLALSPWLYRNYRVHGETCLSTAGGRVLWIGNNRRCDEIYPRESLNEVEWAAWRDLPESSRNHILSASELEQNRLFRRMAISFILDNPMTALRLAVKKICAAFSPVFNPRDVPNYKIKSIVYFISYTPILVLAVYGIILTRYRWRDFMLVYMAFTGFVIVSAVVFVHTIHRVPLDVYLICFASLTVCRLLERFDIIPSEVIEKTCLKCQT